MNNAGSLGPLELPEPEEMTKGSASFDVYGQAMQAVMNIGITLPNPPAEGFTEKMNSPLTELDDNQLGQLLDEVGRYCEWVDEEYAKIHGMVESAEGELDFVEARVRISIKATVKGRLTERDKRDLVDTNPKVIEAKRKLLYYETMLAIIRPIKDGGQRKWETVSRRITQRGQEVDRMRREGNIAGVPMYSRRRPTP